MLTLVFATALAQSPAEDGRDSPAIEAPEKLGIGLAPHLVPFGGQVRVHTPAGRYGSFMVGLGAAIAVFDSGDGTTPLRARIEVGYDYYTRERYDSLFVGVRAQGSYWTKPPLVGGNNVGVGPLVGRRLPLGESGASVSAAGGALLKYYPSVNVFGDSLDLNDGLQIWPQFELEFTLPTTRR